MSNFFSKYKHIYLFLFPVVFYLVHLGNYAKYVAISQLVPSFLAIYFVVIFGYFFITKYFRTNKDAALVTFFVALIFYFFYGNIRSGISQISYLYFLTPLKFYWPFFLLLLALIFYLSKTAPRFLKNILQYCNALTLILSLTQMYIIVQNYLVESKKTKPVQAIQFASNKNNFTNNIYLIVMDEYAGNISLDNYFKYKNSNFTNTLRAQGFFVRDSSNSNYNMTINSMSSLLNMQYIKYKQLKPYNSYETMYLGCFKLIRENYLFQYLYSQNYKVINNSIFEINGSNNHLDVDLRGKAKNMVHFNIFHNRIYQELFWQLCYGKFQNKWFKSNYNTYLIHNYNEKIRENSIKASKSNNSSTFTYTHFILPHAPYFLDSNSNVMKQILSTSIIDDSIYLHNLIGGSKKISKLTDSILKYNKNAIIVLLSDHGYKVYPNRSNPYIYNNFFAIKLPDSNYAKFENMHTNVNVFRQILNQYFGQQLPILPDSSFYYIDMENYFEPYNFNQKP